MVNIRFGTSGWRAIISDEFTFENVRLVAQAIADHIKSSHKKSSRPKIIIGYDTRFLSNEFARECAKVLSANGIQVFLTDRDTPTPVISYQIIKKKADGGINITASHNPAEYNGIKFSPSSGGPAPLEVTKDIERRIANLIKRGSVCPSRTSAEITIFDPAPEYIRAIKKIVDLPLIKRSKLKFVCDCLHGTGRGYLDRLLKETGGLVEVLRRNPDPIFGGTKPEPSEDNVEELVRTVRKKKAALGLATDGDADRFGIIDRDGTYITPNQVVCLLLHHLIQTRGKKKFVARTVATTHMIDAIAEKEGLKVTETPVGFKFIGEKILAGDCLIGGEESGGLSIAGHLPEKDGILACLLIAELVAAERKSLRSILEYLYKKYGRFCSKRIDIPLKEDLKERLKLKLQRFKPHAFAGKKVIDINRIDGHKFVLSDGSWMLFRFSGTEPLVRCYLESGSQSGLSALEKSARNILKTN